MTSHWRTLSTLPLAAALFSSCACSGTIDEPTISAGGDPTNEHAVSPESVADEDGVVLGTSWQALSYPTCSSAAADRDGDGFGFENFRSCIVPKTVSNDTTQSSPSAGSAQCQNIEGVASTMAALAVSAAMEIGRWQPSRDFTIGTVGSAESLILTTEAKSRCADRVCSNTQALLDFQKNEANGAVRFPGNVTLNSPALRSRLVAKFREQVTCEVQPSNGGASNCPVEEHMLTFQRSEKGGCDTNFFFVARKPDGQPLQYPEQLKNKLLWVDRTNPYIGFQSVGEVVSVDPTFGLNERGSAATGTCAVACVMIGSADLAGDCCSCGGATKSLVRSAWSTSTFLCQ